VMGASVELLRLALSTCPLDNERGGGLLLLVRPLCGVGGEDGGGLAFPSALQAPWPPVCELQAGKLF